MNPVLRRGHRSMRSVICHISISLDGYVAGPSQSLENPLGEGGLRLHEWVFGTAAWRRQHGLEDGEPGPDSDVVEAAVADIGAYIMGRNMFGGGDGSWDPAWRGWWGEYPPYHVPVFVLTHHPREALPMDGGTTFHFVTDGIRSALDQARTAAGELDVSIASPAVTHVKYRVLG
jgi:dihydrofolate reductase